MGCPGSVAVGSPARAALGIAPVPGTRQQHLQHLQACASLEGPRTEPYGGAAGRCSHSSSAEGQLTLLSHSGLQVREKGSERIFVYLQ